MLKDYIIFDIDTTRLDNNHDYVNKIFAIKVLDNKIKDILNITFKYSSLNDNKKRFIEFIENYNLITYCNEFNKTFFKLDINNKIIDITKLAKKIYPELKTYSLTHIADYLEIKYKNNIELSDYGYLLYEVYKKIQNDILDLKIKNYIKENNNITISNIQRKFLIGFNRAKRLLELNNK